MPNTTTITANTRLATYLRQQHDHAQLEHGFQCWESPCILPWQAWLVSLWQTLPSQKLLMTTAQEQVLWQQIISDENNPLLMQSQQIAQLVKQAWQFCRQWQVAIETIEHFGNEDVKAFCRFASRFKTICDERHFIDNASIADDIIAAINNHQLHLPEKIKLVGFDELPPRSLALINALKNQAEVAFQSNNIATNNSYQFACNTIQDEINIMARWAEQQINQQKRIACVVPNLSELRDDIERALLKQNPQLPFNISAGKSLADHALIQTALSLLSLQQYNRLIDISVLLLSPYLANSQSEYLVRAECDAKLRDQGETEISLGLLKANTKKFSPLFYQCVDASLKIKTTANSPSQWANYFFDVLSAFGWPGERSLTSLEYQLQVRFINLLHEFADYDWVMPNCNKASATKLLNQLTTDTIFQAKTDDKPLQVLGLLEVTGQQFDAIWVLNCHADNLPAAAKPNPFLPIQLQRELNMPHATAKRELTFTQNILQRLHKSCAEIIFSYSQQEDDKQLQASPLISMLKPKTIDELELTIHNDLYKQIADRQNLEYLLDNKAPKLTATEDIYGGTGILKAQSLCPFQAFARYRLGANSLSEPINGLDAGERGSMLHEILESLWQELSSQQQLSSLTEDALSRKVGTCVKKTLQHYQHYRPYTFTERFMQIEQQRLTQLTLNWLNYEKQRPPFSVIAEESEIQATIAGLTIHMQIDRIDQLDTGEIIIIDYKTGKPTLTDLFNERLFEPQLPLYCINYDKPVSGVLFAQINPSLMRFKGITADDYQIPDTYNLLSVKLDECPNSWEELKQIWHAQIEQLAEEFTEGFAEVAPTSPIKSCLYCDLDSLCRIHEAA